MDRHAPDQSLNADDPVSEAAFYAGHLVEAEKATTGQGTLDAARNIATRYRLPPALIRALVQPSRRPKDIGTKWWPRIRAAYLDHLRRQLQATELEIARVEALGAPDGALHALLDQAEAQVRRIKALIDD